MLQSLQDNLTWNAVADWAQSLFDLLVVWFVFYQLLRLIKGTRAERVLLGLVIVVIMYVMSSPFVLGLSASYWLLDRFIGSIILVVVVLFQQDLRRALADFAAQPFSWARSEGKQAHLAEELVRACFRLSDARLGGLIALEMQGDLEPYLRDAFQIDGRLSKELLFAIFNPEHANPLHDGAVVIRGDRIVAAGVFLPLSSDPRIPRHLGTRHRAAIGLSEDTDAIVLIVSEETGRVSVARAGVLHLALDPNGLREVLQKQLGVRDKRGSKATSPEVRA
jgi:diadenylate cyclase